MRLLLILVYTLAIISFNACDKNTPVDTNTDAGKPIVKILKPKNNEEVSNIVPIQVEAYDDKGIVKVEIYIDGTLKQEIIIPPYEYNWDVNFEKDSTLHLIYAKAYDADDNVSSTMVINVIVRKYPAPTNIIYEIINEESINLNWSYQNASDFSFIIEESIDGTYFNEILETKVGVTTALINRPFYSSSLYRYRVIAKKGNVYSSPSEIQSIIIQIPKPANFAAEIINSNTVKLVWNDMCNFEIGYVIEKQKDNESIITLANLSANTIEYIDYNYNNIGITTYTIKTISKHFESEPVTIIVFNGYPSISNLVVEPDTLTVVTSNLILNSINVTHPAGLVAIEKVYFVVYRPDGSSNNIENQMFDDGNMASHGDKIAGDGIYSLIIQVTSTNTKGTYRFEFRARDKRGGLSNIINRDVLIK